ncbi:MAG: autotransporter strand-loop-strand O-heptosyltransferase [Pelosinus sp.]|nr:autotransporter strand-loop-strand O-heptosyltransferase [Pelosinus sp.]
MPSDEQQTDSPQTPYMLFYDGPLTCKTDIKGLEFDFNHGARIKVPEGNWRVKIIDQDSCLTLYDASTSNAVVVSSKKYYINFRLEIYRDNELILTHDFTPRHKKILLQYPCRSILGDTIASMPYAQVFKYRHDCEVYLTVHPELAAICKATYPEIHFITPDERPPDIYATYYIGFFFPCSERIYHPVDWRITGLQKTIAFILGLKPEAVRANVAPSNLTRTIKEPYVCIAAQATSQAKYWNNPLGWLETIEYLKNKGYRVLCMDKDRCHGSGNNWNTIPFGAEDFTGPLPLQDRIDLLFHADFFIGLSSGLAWLAWAAGKPVVLISGFSLPVTEFYTPYRVINYHVCNGCFTDTSLEFNNWNFVWCPRHQGTDRQFECTRFITAGHVQKTIDKLMTDYCVNPLHKEEVL